MQVSISNIQLKLKIEIESLDVSVSSRFPGLPGWDLLLDSSENSECEINNLLNVDFWIPIFFQKIYVFFANSLKKELRFKQPSYQEFLGKTVLFLAKKN